MERQNTAAVISDPKARQHIRNTGIVLTIIGFAGIALPQFATLAVELLLAWILIAAGAAGLLFSWKGRDFPGWWHTSITFLLTLILGFVFLLYPFSGIATMTIFLVALLTLQGIAYLVFGTRLRTMGVENWFWVMFSGLSSLVIAGLILWGWPGSAAWAIGLLIGFNFLTTGLSLISIAYKVHTKTM